MADYSFEKAHEILRDRRYTAEKEALERKLDLMNKEPEYAQIETALLEAGRDSLTAAMTRDKSGATSPFPAPETAPASEGGSADDLPF